MLSLRKTRLRDQGRLQGFQHEDEFVPHRQGENDDMKDFFVALDVPELRQLSALVSRALAKDRALHNLAATAGMQCLEVDET